MTSIKVKPLVWEKTRQNATQEARCLIGIYRTYHAANGGYSVALGLHSPVCSESGMTNFATIDDAKAAAQAEFDRRILDCIEAPA